jgi:hypothetical protein
VPCLPYKWIRYATRIVVEAQGDLCTERDLPNPVPINYESCLSAPVLPHTDQEKCHVFMVDPRLADTRTLTASRTSTGRDNFRGYMEHRDERCVLSGDPP